MESEDYTEQISDISERLADEVEDWFYTKFPQADLKDHQYEELLSFMEEKTKSLLVPVLKAKDKEIAHLKAILDIQD